MTPHTRSVLTPLVLAVCTTAACLNARAVDATRYISIKGNNANPCSLAKPCRSLQRGINMTPPGGELRILNSGAYGINGTINKSMTISGNGHTVDLGGPIIIDKPDVVVVLRGLVLNGQGNDIDGISIQAAVAVHIERCVVFGVAGEGVEAVAPEVRVFIVDTISRDNGANGFVARFASQVTINNSRFENNAGYGIEIRNGLALISRSISAGNLRGVNLLGASSSVTISSTTVSGNVNAGIYVVSGRVTVDSSVAHGNQLGLRADAGAVATISNSAFINNGVGVSVGGNNVQTRQNNTIRGNTAFDIFGTLTPLGGV